MIYFRGNEGLGDLSPSLCFKFYQIVNFSADFPLRGVFVNGSVLTPQQIIKESESNIELNAFNLFVLRGLIGKKGKVYYIPNISDFLVSEIDRKAGADQIKLLRKELGREKAAEIQREVYAANRMEIAHDKKEIQNEIDSLYKQLGKEVIVRKYLNCFKTKRQVESGAAMAPSKELRLLKELLEMSGGSFEYNAKPYTFPKEIFHSTLEYIAGRNIVGFSNHNYLKKVLMNPKKQNKKSVEGY